MTAETPLLKQLQESGRPYKYTCKNGVETFEFLPDPPICGAHCKSTGEPCRLSVSAPGARCRFHGGKSTGPKTPAGRAAIASANSTRKGTRYKLLGPKPPPDRCKPKSRPPLVTLADLATRELERRARLEKDA